MRLNDKKVFSLSGATIDSVIGSTFSVALREFYFQFFPIFISYSFLIWFRNVFIFLLLVFFFLIAGIDGL